MPRARAATAANESRLGGEWGTAVHSLLNALGRTWAPKPPEAKGPPVGDDELLGMAGNALAAVGMGREGAAELSSLARSIVRSEFWSRAMAARRKHFEVPFSVRVGPEDRDYAELANAAPLVALGGARPVAVAPGAPVLLSGAIDVAFFEDGGWVIADYKSDRVSEAALDAFVAYYRPQVELYTRYWAKITGEKVKETGLYFTALDRWVPIAIG